MKFRAFPARTVWFVAAALLVALVMALPAAAQDTPHFLTLNYWPIDAPHWFVIDYPDTEWTWNFLGLNPGKDCPPFLIHDREKSLAYWRDPSLPEGLDWEQASHGGQWVSCYRRHAGTDIAAPPYSPVYAAADGEVTAIEPGRDDKGANASLTVLHHRDIAGYSVTWTARYIHLDNAFPVRLGRVKEGQLIGFVADRGDNTHLHFEMDDFWGCDPPCIVNPWGPIFLFFDDDHDHRPDPAPAILQAAQPGAELVGNGDFSQGWANWMALSGGEDIRDGALRLARPVKAERPAGAQQVIPYALPPATRFEVSLTLANEGDAPAAVWVSLRDARGFDRSAGCAFSLPPHAPPATYRLRGLTKAQWANLILLISAGPADGNAEVVVDDVSIKVGGEGSGEDGAGVRLKPDGAMGDSGRCSTAHAA